MSEEIEILVVDDDPDILFATARVVRKAGYPVVEASSGGECLQKIRESKPDILLLDVLLPDAEGPDICRRIKGDADLKSIYVILISGVRTASDDQADGLDGGADGYIARPISNRELVARVRAMERILTAERERDRLIVRLQDALAKVKTLSGMLPLCSYCKNIRDDEGYWNQIEAYIAKHSDAEFSHSICPDCAEKHFPEMDLYGPSTENSGGGPPSEIE